MWNDQQKMVLACIDGSEFSTAVCDYAAWVSTREGVQLKLLHNIEQTDAPPTSDLSGAIGLGSQERLLAELAEVEQHRSKLLLHKGKLMLEAAEARVRAFGVESPIVKLRHGSLLESLLDLEDEIRVLVLGVRGQQHQNNPGQVGAQLETIIRSLRHPVLVVNRAFTPPQRVMIAYDGSEAAQKAVDMVATSPLYQGLPCHLVYVSREAAADSVLSAAAQQLTNAGIEVVASRLDGKVDEQLFEYQKRHDIELTVMGAFSHRRIHDLLLGSFTHKMLTSASQPLLLLR